MAVSERRLDRVRKGAMAQQLKSQLIDDLLDRENEILQALIGKYKMGQLRGEDAAHGVAEISAMRDLMSKYDRDIKLGHQASEEEFGSEDRED